MESPSFGHDEQTSGKWQAVSARWNAFFSMTRWRLAGADLVAASRPVVLLAGLGATAHAFDAFAFRTRGANRSCGPHMISKPHEADLLREMRAFIDGLP